jgi:hypothetical protein
VVGTYYSQQAGTMMGGQRDVRHAVIFTPGPNSQVFIAGGLDMILSNPAMVQGAIALDYDSSGDVEVDGNTDFERGAGLNGNWVGTPSIDIDFLMLDQANQPSQARWPKAVLPSNRTSPSPLPSPPSALALT